MVHVNSQEADSIMKLIPVQEPERVKKPRYISKYRPLVELEYTKGKYAHRTLGVPTVQKNDRRAASAQSRERKKFHDKPEVPRYVKGRKERKRPETAVVTATKTLAATKDDRDLPELPKDPLKTARVNYTKENVVKAKKLKPPEPKKRTVDTRFGDTFDVISSGLYPVYVRKKGYGKVPKNILKVDKKKSTTKMEEKEDSAVPEELSMLKQHCRCISASERDQLLKGMKKRWNEMMLDFQRLPFVIDTLPKAQRKTHMERELDKLEKDIDTIERHPYLYVYSDDEE